MTGLIPTSWRWGLGLAAALALVLVGWKVNQWRMDAARAADLQRTLDAERAANVKADIDRLNVGLAIAAREGAEESRTTFLMQKVPVYVQDNRACDLGLDAVRLLNEARRMPTASDAAPRADAGATADP